MIQRERERRAVSRVQEETLQTEEATKQQIEADKHWGERAEEKKMIVERDRCLLRALPIPDYLKAIIDEEQLKGGHVLWEKARFVDDIFFTKHAEKSPSNIYTGGGMALVWDIHYITRYEDMRTYNDRGGLPGYKFGDTGEHDGYIYRSVRVRGNWRNNSLEIWGRKGEEVSYSSISLSGQQLNSLEVKKALASTYLDTANSSSRDRSVLDWPFETRVSEQDNH